MKVKVINLLLPIILLIILIIGSIFLIQHFSIEEATQGMDYKEKLFIEDQVGLIEITTEDNGWEEILADPTAEEYVEATVTINGETFEHVGLRAKGNSSLKNVASSDSNRYSLKIDFSQYVSDQTYYGLEKINLNNNFSDTTQMKEFVSYELMEQIGINTLAHSYVKVTINGEDYALMLAVEEVGEAFLTTNYGSTEGFLFKPEDSGSNLVYTTDDPDDYSGIFNGVKVNKKTAEKNSNIITMMKEISENNLDSLDVDQLARYFAMNTALVNMDSYQGSFHHNYYLYETLDGIFSIIPWDYNMSFGGFQGGGGADGGGGRGNAENGNMNDATNENPPELKDEQPTNQTNETVNQTNRNNFNANKGNNDLMMGGNMMSDSNINLSITNPVSGTTLDETPLLKVILEDEYARSLYDGYLEEIANNILTEENVQSITNQLKDLLLDEVEADPTKFATTEQFLEGVSGHSSLASFAAKRSESILKQLAGEIEGVSNEGSSNGMNGMPAEPPEWNTDGQMPSEPPEWNTDGQMPSEPPEWDTDGQMPNTPPDMNDQNGTNQQGGMQGTPPEFNSEETQNGTNQTEGTNQLGEMPGTPPASTSNSDQDGIDQLDGTNQQDITSNNENVLTNGENQTQVDENVQQNQTNRPDRNDFTNRPNDLGNNVQGQATHSTQYYLLILFSFVCCIGGLSGIYFVSRKKYKRGMK